MSVEKDDVSGNAASKQEQNKAVTAADRKARQNGRRRREARPPSCSIRVEGVAEHWVVPAAGFFGHPFGRLFSTSTPRRSTE